MNVLQHFAGFVYRDIRLVGDRERLDTLEIEVVIEAAERSRGRCPQCLRRSPGYDHNPARRWLFVPLWMIPVWFVYAPRRINCIEHGTVTEHMPWSDGKSPVTKTMMLFLARWARRMSWKETAEVFRVSWETVYRSVEMVVEWGLEHRQLSGIEAIGVDEIHWGRGKKASNFLTVIYQIDSHCRRLLWVGPRRTQATLRKGLKSLGAEVVKGLRYVCSDMCKPYLKVLKEEVGHALNILDRFHITKNLNDAVDQVRRAETTRLKAHSKQQAQKLKNMRWPLLRRGSRVRGKARQKLKALLASKLATAKAWELKETFTHFWSYKSLTWAGAFLDYWCERAVKSRLEPMTRVARTLRAHRSLLMNWFRAKGALSSGAVEGLNNKIRVVTRRSYGLRTYKAMELSLYHNLGRLPEPEWTHKFC